MTKYQYSPMASSSVSPVEVSQQKKDKKSKTFDPTRFDAMFEKLGKCHDQAEDRAVKKIILSSMRILRTITTFTNWKGIQQDTKRTDELVKNYNKAIREFYKKGFRDLQTIDRHTMQLVSIPEPHVQTEKNPDKPRKCIYPLDGSFDELEEVDPKDPLYVRVHLSRREAIWASFQLLVRYLDTAVYFKDYDMGEVVSLVFKKSTEATETYTLKFDDKKIIKALKQIARQTGEEPKNIINRWYSICMEHLEGYLVKNPHPEYQFIRCYNPNCLRHHGDTCRKSEESYYCQKCYNSTCLRCGKEYHPDFECNLTDDEMTGQIILRNTKPCPVCQHRVEKIGGCDHMICTRCLPHTHWCWGCGIQLHGPNFYRHNGTVCPAGDHHYLLPDVPHIPEIDGVQDHAPEVIVHLQGFHNDDDPVDEDDPF